MLANYEWDFPGVNVREEEKSASRGISGGEMSGELSAAWLTHRQTDSF